MPNTDVANTVNVPEENRRDGAEDIIVKGVAIVEGAAAVVNDPAVTVDTQEKTIAETEGELSSQSGRRVILPQFSPAEKQDKNLYQQGSSMHNHRLLNAKVLDS